MNRKAKILILFCLLIAVMSTMLTGFAVGNTSLEVDGTLEPISTQMIGGSTYVPVRDFCNRMGSYRIQWDPETRTATVQGMGVNLVIKADGAYVEANERCFYLPEGVYKTEGALYLPVTTLAKCLGAAVMWNDSHTVLHVTRTQMLESGDSYYDAEDLYWLSHIIYAESGCEPLVGQIAVGNVVLNRVNNSRFPATVYGVITQKNQFSPVANGSVKKTPTEESIAAAKIALEGEQVAGNVLFFLNRSIARSAWMERNCVVVAVIGRHTFYTYA